MSKTQQTLLKEAEHAADAKAHTDDNQNLISQARTIAHKLYERDGVVSSTSVFNVMMKDTATAEAIRKSDKRWMGAVFRYKEWNRLGWIPGGSHGRPISVWTLNSPGSVRTLNNIAKK